MRKEAYYTFIILFVLISASFFLLYTKPAITGNVIYEYEEYAHIWDFGNSSDYQYNNSRVSLTEGQANLISIAEDNSWMEESANFSLVDLALKNGDDRTNRIISVGNGYIEADEDDVIDVTFDHELDNGDMINLYLKGNHGSNISLCDEGAQCNMSNYGFLEYPGDEDFYQITVENLQEPKDTFGFDVNDRQVRFDYMNASYTAAILHNVTNYTYYNSSIETNDLEVEDINKWGIFTANDSLNNQAIIYEYSTDSGDNWIGVNNNNNLSDVNSNKLRFRANLESDNTGTPYVYSLSLDYTTAYCTENWNCSGWNECSDGNLQTRACIDLNECGMTNDMPNEAQDCVYYSNYYEINNSGLISIRRNTLTTINSSNIVLDILVGEDINFTNFTLRNYNNHSNLLYNKVPLNKYADIENDFDFNNAVLKVYYTDEEIISLNEDSLKIYYYNETSEQWQALESFINNGENYVWANLSHLSTYSVFGDRISAIPSSSSNSGSSGGGGSSGGISQNKKSEDAVDRETKKEIKEIHGKPEVVIPVMEVAEEKEEKNIFSTLTGQAVKKFRDLENYVIDIIILLLIVLGILMYKSIVFFRKK